MYRLLSCTAVVVCMALTPALAADDSSQAGAHPINQLVPKSKARRHIPITNFRISTAF
jgi:hypothetical protein